MGAPCVRPVVCSDNFVRIELVMEDHVPLAGMIALISWPQPAGGTPQVEEST
jgi:hypothetical protein